MGVAEGQVPPRTDSISRRQRWLRAAAWVVLAVSAVAMVTVATWHIRQQRHAAAEARNKARARVIESAQAVETALQRAPPIAFELARDLSTGQLDPRNVVDRLVADLTKHPHLFEIGLAYLPFMRDPEVRLYAPHASRTAGTVTSYQLEARNDYTTEDWFKSGQRTPAWGDPHVVNAAPPVVVGYAVPFFKPGVAPLEVAGLVRASVTLDDLRPLIAPVSAGQTGYGLLVSRKGIYLEHPDHEYVRGGRSAIEDARQSNDEVRLEALEGALRGEPTEHDSRSQSTGQDIWVFNEPLKSTGWVLSAATVADPAGFGSIELRRALVPVAVCLVSFLFAAIILVRRAR